MVLPSTGAISLANIQTEFGGANPIGLNEYYLNSVYGYVSGTGATGIPTTGAISLLQFYGKSKVIGTTEYMIAGNVAGSMDETGGSRMGIDGVDDSFAGIGTVFQFFWFGTDYGSGNNIQWTTNNVMTFGGGSSQYTSWAANVRPGVLMGQYDRRTNYSTQFAPTSNNGYNIKRFIVVQHNYYYGSVGNEIQMEIRLLRGPQYQYIEIRMANWTAGTGGIWNISDGSSFYNPFSGAPPVGTGASVVLRGSLTGTNWVAYNNYYMNLSNTNIVTPPPTPIGNAITDMGANLVLRLDGYNIDGTNNSTLTSGTTISSWYNSGNTTGLTTTQGTISSRPTYTTNGAVFSNGKVLISNINLNTYSTMNIFVVWKKTLSSSTLKWLWSQDNGGYDRTLIIVNDNSLYVGTGDGAAASPSYSFPINTTVIVNCEYNSSGLGGNFYINNTSITGFTSLAASGTTSTFFGSLNASATYTTAGAASVDGIIYEIIIINRLITATERTNIYNLLNTRWGPV